MAVYACGDNFVSRGQSDYSQIYQDAGVIPRQSLSGLTECNFSYYAYDKELKAYGWTEEWEKTDLPIAIRVNLAMGQERYVKTVDIPVAGYTEAK